MAEALLVDNIGGNPISGVQDTIPNALKGGADQDLARYRKMFDNARWQTNEARLKAQRDRDYYDGPKQLDSDVRRVLEMRKQPPIYTNRIRPAINGILGVILGSSSDPRAFARAPDKDNEADVVTKVLRYIADTTHFDQTKTDVAENFLVESIGAVIIEAQGNDVPVTQIRYEEFFYDPFSRRNDFKDATYLGIAKWMNAEDVKAIYPEQYAAMGDPIMGMGGVVESTWNDRPENTLQWVDAKQRRLMVVECYYREGGEWMRIVYCWSGIFEQGVSPYQDDRGHSICPIEAVSCYVDRENRRYGVVRDMIPIQDEINASRSRSLHLMNARQLQQTDPMAAPVDADTARMEASKADGVLPPGWQIVATTQQLQGNLERVQEAKSEIERMGPTPAILGRTGAESQSGRARQVLQQAGMTELARPLARVDDWQLRVYKQMWFRAKQYWKDEMFIRIANDARAPEFIGLNQPKQGVVQREVPAMDPWGQPALHPETGMQLTQIVPSVEIIGYDNQVSDMSVDIVLDTTPDTANLEQELWKDLMDLAEKIPFESPQFLMAIELSPMPNKLQTIERIKKLQAEMRQQNAPQQQEAAQKQQVVEQLQMSGEQIKQQETGAKIQNELATAARTRAETATMLMQATGQAEASDINGME